jgi:hypothetical protein
VDKLNTFEWDADANNGAGGFYDPATPTKIYSPAEFTAMKNEISTKLDKDLTAKKMRPLGVRFDVKSTTPGAQPAAAAPAGAPAAAPPAAQGEPAIKAGNGQQLSDRGLAAQYLQQAGGDKAKARELAGKDGWKF